MAEQLKYTYDLNVILEGSLDEGRVNGEKDAIANLIEKVEGEITAIDEWGNRRFAYPINKQDSGYYIIYQVSLPAEAPRKIEEALKIRDNVVRILITRERPEWHTRKDRKDTKKENTKRDVSSPAAQVEAAIVS